MINNVKQFNRKFILPNKYNQKDIQGVYEISNRHLIIVDDREESKSNALRLIDAWNKAGKKGVYAKVKHNKTSTNNVFYLKDSTVESLFDNQGEVNYNETFLTLLKNYSKKYHITKFGAFDCDGGTKTAPKEPTVFFDGLGSGNIRPSDIDSVIIEGDLLIYMEIKTDGGTLGTGQRLVIERICTAWENAGGVAIGLLVREQGYKREGDIKGENCMIEKSFRGGKWSFRNYRLLESLEEIMNIYKK